MINFFFLYSLNIKDNPCRQNDNGKEAAEFERNLFFITVTLPELYSTVHSDFVDYFKNVFSYCSCVEESRLSGSVSHHLHVFFRICSAAVSRKIETVGIFVFKCMW